MPAGLGRIDVGGMADEAEDEVESEVGHEHGARLKTKSVTNMNTTLQATSRPDQITSTGREDGQVAPTAPSGGRKARTRASPEQELSRIRRQATTEETWFDHGTSRIHGGSKARDEAETPEEKVAREQARSGRSKQKTYQSEARKKLASRIQKKVKY